MSGHADTIRRFANDTDSTGEVVAALDALLAENQRLKLAKANAEIALMQQLETNTRRTGELVDVLAENQRLRATLRMMKPYAERYASADEIAQVREALAGDTE